MKVSYYTLLFCFFFLGCDTSTKDPILPSSLGPDLTIEASKRWQLANPSRTSSEFTALWHLALSTTFEENTLVVAPAYFPNGTLKIANNPQGTERVQELSRFSFVFYYNKEKEIAASLMAEEATPGPRNTIYFFDYEDLSLQSIWEVDSQTLVGYSSKESQAPGNARIKGCDFVDKWVNHCDRTARSDGHSYCWEYLGKVWTCFPSLQGELPGGGGGGSGGGGGTPTPSPSPSPSPTPTLPPINFPSPPATGFSPYVNQNFAITLNQDKLEMLLALQKPQRLVPLLFAANVKSNTYFTEEEYDYLETFSDAELLAMADFLNEFPTMEIAALEGNIKRIKNRFNQQEKEILWEYSGGNTAKYRLNVLRYGANAFASIQATHAYFGNKFASECADCKGNAFKHALFRIFDAESFGREIAVQLGEAHEAGQQLDAGTIMDKKNNAVGLQIYDRYRYGGAGVLYWGSKVGESMKNGELVFLIDGQEVPSNQNDPLIRGSF